MATGLITKNADDLDDVLEPRVSTKIADVGILSNGGVDISNRFEGYVSGSKAADTGFISGGSDLKDLFAPKGGVVTFEVTVSPANTIKVRSNGTETINLSSVINGGIGPFTYQWTKSITGGSSSFVGGTTSSTAQVSVSGTDQDVGGSITLTVTDTGNSNDLAVDASTVAITFGNPPE